MKHALLSLLVAAALGGCAAAPIGHVEPMQAGQHNEAGIKLAAQGRHDEAIAEFQSAIALEPGRAYLHNNLAYAYLLRGQPALALQAFEAALYLEPRHPVTLQNVRKARAAMAPAPVAAAPAPAPKPVTVPAAAQPSAVSISRVAPHVYELRAPAHVAAPPAAPAEKRAPTRQARVDVANGNGITGMARRVAKQLASEGLLVARVTNAASFHEPATVVQFRPGHESEALELAGRVPSARTAPSDALPAGIDLRLVLGRNTTALAALAD